MERYKKIKDLYRHKGQFDYQISKYRDLETKKYVDIQEIQMSHLPGRGISTTCELLTEVGLLKEARHENVVRLLDVVWQQSNPEYMFLVYEHLDSNLENFIKRGKMTPSLTKKFLSQILSALRYLHSIMIYHQDLTLAHILVDHEENVKISHFGSARETDLPLTVETETGCEYYCEDSDIISAGLIFAKMALGNTKLSLRSELIFRDIGRSLLLQQKLLDVAVVEVLESHLNDHGLELLKKMLCAYPDQRITAREALKEPYFRE